eukprot:2596450-Rhodomonas_salina.1
MPFDRFVTTPSMLPSSRRVEQLRTVGSVVFLGGGSEQRLARLFTDNCRVRVTVTHVQRWAWPRRRRVQRSPSSLMITCPGPEVRGHRGHASGRLDHGDSHWQVTAAAAGKSCIEGCVGRGHVPKKLQSDRGQ